jgi:pSer/pThr/pTyr-binding forkhead associated (FHA) protein
MPLRNQYVIVRDDLPIDPVTIISEGLLIGRLTECEVLLNHPSVSRVQAGIKQIDEEYFLFPLRASNPVLLNGKTVEGNEALASGDIIEVGPFQLDIDSTEESLVIRVSLEIGVQPSEIDVSDPGFSTDKLIDSGIYRRPPKERPPPVTGTRALDIFWDKRIREAGKMVRPSPLFPRSKRRSGKIQYNWLPTTDLLSRWPVSFFIWGTIGVGLLSVAAAYWYSAAFAPAPLSRVHAAKQFAIIPPVAQRANAGSCTTCHAWGGNMEKQCADCHQTDAFVATVIKPHEAAGIGCVSCHAEHMGADFSATEGALNSCTTCHNDSNKSLYQGRSVGTPHGGTFGYPVVNGVWSLKAINDEEWDLRKIPIVRLPTDTDEKWKSKQFHALHSERVRVVQGLSGNALGQLSCSSCHKSFDPIDRDTPRQTCGTCHNGRLLQDGQTVNRDAPNCTSCHVQHIKDSRRWGTSLLARVVHSPAGL